jgi:uncharacterized protein (TIGR04255 family)
MEKTAITFCVKFQNCQTLQKNHACVKKRDMIFANPPLIELVAELRWVPGVAGPIKPDSGAVSVQFPMAFVEESFDNFRRSIATKGFTNSERLIPLGFPTLPFVVAQRFRKPSNNENYVFQVGLGVFSANALPPYRDWDSFRPIVREGVETLLSSRHSSDKANISVLLRYLDVFTEELTEGRKSADFMNDILGIKLTLPATLAEQVSNLRDLRAGLQLSFNIKDALSMNIGIQEGTVGTKTGVVMSTEVATLQPVKPQIDEIMQNFERAHNYIRDTFIGLTTQIRDKMKPVEA